MNFKFKEVTADLRAKVDRIKEEKSLIVKAHSLTQKEVKAMLEELSQVVKPLESIFSKEAQKSPAKLRAPRLDTRYQSRDFWAKADEKMAKVKNERMNLFKPLLERTEVPAQI